MSEAAPAGWDTSEGLLTPAEVAELYRVNLDTVSSWARNGVIPAIRPGGQWRFSAKWVREDQRMRLQVKDHG